MISVLPRIIKNCNKNYGEKWPDWADKIKANKTFSCIDPDDPLIAGKTIYNNYGDSLNGFSLISIYLNKCVNITQINKTNCHPQSKIDDALSEMFITYGAVDYLIDNYNSTTAAIPYFKAIVMPVSGTIFKRFYLRFRNVEYTTDVGYVFESLVTEKFNKYETFTESADNRKVSVFPGNFAMFSLTTSDILQTHGRSYLKLQNLLANIGGVAKGVTFLATLFANYFSDVLFMKQLANDFVHFDTSDLNSSSHSGKKIQLINDLSSFNERNNLARQSKNMNSNNFVKTHWTVLRK